MKKCLHQKTRLICSSAQNIIKIGINGRFLSKPFTGIGQHTINLIKELAKIDMKNEYIVFAHENVPINIRKEFPKNVEIRILHEKKIPSAGARKVWWEQIQLTKILKKEKFDIAYFPYPSNPWTKDFYGEGMRVFVTVHDCLPWKYKHYNGGILSRTYNNQCKKAVGKADKIFTVSKTSKKEISEICKIDSDKIFVIYNDAGDIFKKHEGDAGETTSSRTIFENDTPKILEKFALQKNRFFFYCGGYDERKNVSKLVKEYETFIKNYDEEIPLVLAGGKVINNDLYKSFDEAKSAFGEIVKTGFLEEEELKSLYENCLAFVNLSREEGFNIPLVEAANCEAPLIVSDTEIHREIVGGNADFVDLSKDGNCAEAMGKMLNPEHRNASCKNSEAIAKKYSWKTSAKKLKDVLFS